MENVSKYLILVIMLFVSSCNNIPSLEQLELSKTEKFQYLEGVPVNIDIDESNNGLILLSGKVYKIKDLNITNDNLDLRDNNRFPIAHLLYEIDKFGNGILLYTRYIYETNRFVFPEVHEKQIPLYSVRIIKNELIYNSIRELNKDFEINTIGFINFSSENYGIYYTDIHRDVNLTLENIVNENVTTHKLSETFKDNSLLGINLNSKGDGWYFYSSIKEGIAFRLFTLKNYSKAQEKLKEELDEEIKNNSQSMPFFKANLDLNGTGYILSSRFNPQTDIRKLFIQKFENFNKTTEKQLIFENNEINNELIHTSHYPDSFLYYNPFIYMNKEGNGIIFMNKKFADTKEHRYTYIKKIINFKVDDKEVKLLDSSKYSYHKFKVNEKGNGLVILKKNDSEKNIFIAKKIRNFEPEN
ncbi:MAG: hypothetical protein U0354_01485 [Candidatus Sericytochromatia bacterium]